MALGPTQPPIQWVPKTIYGPGTHSAPNSVGTKDNLWPWDPLSPQFSRYQRQFMALGPTQPQFSGYQRMYGPGTHPASNPVSKFVPLHAMKMYNPCTRWRWMVNLKPQLFLPQKIGAGWTTESVWIFWRRETLLPLLGFISQIICL
jgi:hypothetical protein